MSELYKTLLTYRICSKCNEAKEISSNFKPKRQECNECLLQRKRTYYNDRKADFKAYYQRKKAEKLAAKELSSITI